MKYIKLYLIVALLTISCKTMQETTKETAQVVFIERDYPEVAAQIHQAKLDITPGGEE